MLTNRCGEVRKAMLSKRITVVVQELFNEVHMCHEHPPAAVSYQAQCIECISALYQ